MCGLFGAYSFDRSTTFDESALATSLSLLEHRGPDASGRHIEPGIALGHTRLSFLDLSPEGTQPLWDRQHRYAIVYNGEIYNFRQLRAELEATGVVFRTASDTEVLLYGLIVHGPSFLPRAMGMFAFALYDSFDHSLLLGRDRFGIKPLFVARSARGVVFASEIKALRPWLRFAANERALAAYMVGFDLPTANQSMIEGVEFFQAGSTQKFDAQNGAGAPVEFFPLRQFWDEGTMSELARQPVPVLVDRFDELLNDSVGQHMISDVPVGALCSGGVDSSVILALARKHSSSLAIFHANVVGPQSEYPAARQLAGHLKLDLVSVDVRDEDFIDQFIDIIHSFESPFLYHPNSVPFRQVMRLVQQNGIKAVLTGEGADEILLGYSHIPLQPAIARYHAALDSVRSAFHRLPWIGRTIWRSPGDSKALIGRQLISGFEGAAAPGAPVGSGESSYATAYHLLTYHLRTLLKRNDRLGMAASIEARFPFLGHSVVEFAVNLPESLKIRVSRHAAREVRHPFFSTKWILREVAARYLPRSLAYRVKRGFPTNAFERISVDGAFLDESWIATHFSLDSVALQALRSRASRSDLLRLVMLETWARVVLEGEAPDHVLRMVRKTLGFGPAGH